MIRLTDPARIGPALAQIRALLGISRREMARTVATRTGRSVTSVNSQMWGWDNGIHAPDLASLPLLLDLLGYDLALIPQEDA
jgi:transcriptional regulator with XRE-family HTH domain